MADYRPRVTNATVHLPDEDGQGVLVQGGFILTATHCIKWSGDGGMALGDYHVENVTTKDGSHLRVGPWAADPISDIAVLGPLDDQMFFRDATQFEAWCEATEAVPLMRSGAWYRSFASRRAYVLTHKGAWIKAKITNYGGQSYRGGCMFIETDNPLEGGTSGGPVVNAAGQLIGVVSNFSDSLTLQRHDPGSVLGASAVGIARHPSVRKTRR